MEDGCQLVLAEMLVNPRHGALMEKRSFRSCRLSEVRLSCITWSQEVQLRTHLAFSKACDSCSEGRRSIATLHHGSTLQLVTVQYFCLQVAGLNVGWGQRVDLPWNPATRRFEVYIDLPVGKFPFKFLFDGRWTWSAEHPLMKDGDNLNNFVEVPGRPEGAAVRSRLLREGGDFTEKERRSLQKKFAAGVFHGLT